MRPGESSPVQHPWCGRLGGSVALPSRMVVGHYQPLADDGTLTFQRLPWCAPSDQTCLLQSVQKTKISKPICGQSARFQATGDSLVFGLWENCAPEAWYRARDIPQARHSYLLT